MGVIIAVTMWPKGAEVVVIPERYPLQGARSSRLTAATTRNPATLKGHPYKVRPGAWGPARPGHAEIRSAAGPDAAAAGERGPGAVREPAMSRLACRWPGSPRHSR